MELATNCLCTSYNQSIQIMSDYLVNFCLCKWLRECRDYLKGCKREEKSKRKPCLRIRKPRTVIKVLSRGVLPPKCTGSHEGRLMLDEDLHIRVNKLFVLLFTDSKFYRDFNKQRNVNSMECSSWTVLRQGGSYARLVNMTLDKELPLVGTKTILVTQRQTLLSCSSPGFLFAVDVEIENQGTPYADYFMIQFHYCLKANGKTETKLQVFAQIIYKKQPWGMAKGLIEKGIWSDLESFFPDLLKAIHETSRTLSVRLMPSDAKVRRSLRSSKSLVDKSYMTLSKLLR